jgi:hypothetical protein
MSAEYDFRNHRDSCADNRHKRVKKVPYPRGIEVFRLQLAAVYTPFLQLVLRTVPLTLADWGLVLGFSL